jgi:hypothetical protein
MLYSESGGACSSQGKKVCWRRLFVYLTTVFNYFVCVTYITVEDEVERYGRKFAKEVQKLVGSFVVSFFGL